MWQDSPIYMQIKTYGSIKVSCGQSKFVSRACALIFPFSLLASAIHPGKALFSGSGDCPMWKREKKNKRSVIPEEIFVLCRLRQESHGGAWCPKQQITTEPREWLEINLHTVHMITATATQGRFGNGQGVEYSEAYMLEYWRPKLGKWVRYRNFRGEEVSQSVSRPSVIPSFNERAQTRYQSCAQNCTENYCRY